MNSLTSEELSFIMQHGSQMSKVGLVADNHYDNLWVGMITQFLQPAMFDALKRQVFCCVVDDKCTNCSTVIPVRISIIIMPDTVSE